MNAYTQSKADVKMDTSKPKQKTALVTGANGYIGEAVARAFQRAGFKTLGLVRTPQSAIVLEKHSIIPITGSAAKYEDVLAAVRTHITAIDVIASTTEDKRNYVQHFTDTMVLFRALAKMSNEQGVRPLVLITSGCKDYGPGEVDGSHNLVAHTEEAPLNPPPFLKNRTTYSLQALQEDSFDVVVLRPTNVHGGSSSHFGEFFELAADAKKDGRPLHFDSDPRTIVHSMNVNDCGDAYVALANHPNRSDVAGQCFNISAGKRYETLREVGHALVRLYQIPQGLQFGASERGVLEPSNMLTNFSQYVSSEKIRSLTGWTDESPMFAQDIRRYRLEYLDAKQGGGHV